MSKQKNNEAKNNSDMRAILKITLKLLIISVITALLLSVVNALTKNVIADNAAAEKNAAISEIFTGDITTVLSDTAHEGISELYIVSENDSTIGYAAVVAPLGFGGEITVMVGVDVDGAIVGVEVISHSETPGLGSRVAEQAHLSQYTGKDQNELGEIDVISGSTISSKAVREGVKTALSAYATVFDTADDVVGGASENADGGAA